MLFSFPPLLSQAALLFTPQQQPWSLPLISNQLNLVKQAYDYSESQKSYSFTVFCKVHSFVIWIISSKVIWDEVFKSGLSKICGRQPLKSLKGYGLLKQTLFLQIF